MSRLMSVSHTTEQVRNRTKTVTRRLGWWEDKNGRRLLKAGDRLTLCEKVMGVPWVDCPDCLGEGSHFDGSEEELCLACGGEGGHRPIVRICDVEVVDVRREILWNITDDDVRLEGFRTASSLWFVDFFCETFGGDPMQEVTRIEWRYLDEVAS